ncbi:MAG: di-trans,poly-cis-decaprenylcistransferase [Chloroflexi bacterium]|nr:di-trans,poly-cis-decaprenylcistransferase [Chloroflexota bacterium]
MKDSEARPSAPEARLERIPQHVGIIMDGNGRWAQARGLPRTAGHQAGVERLREILRAAADFGIPILTVFAFSTENWSRPRHEVQAILGILHRVIATELRELHEAGVCIKHLGRTEGLAPELVSKIREAEALTANNQRLRLNIAFNYGGRADIVDAVKRIVAKGLPPEAITEQLIAEHLSTAGQPDPDLIIRTAGEMRLSNFLIWQAAYAEFYSTPTLWPDFGREDLYQALLAYQRRERRFGGLRPSSS